MTTKGNMLEFLNKHSKKIILIVIALAATALVVAVVLLGIYAKTNNVIALVGEEKITLMDLNKSLYGRSFKGDVNDKNLANTLNISKEERDNYIKSLVEQSIVRQYAAKKGIIVSDKEAEERAKKDKPKYNTYQDNIKSIILEQARKNVLADKVSEVVVTWKKGDYVKIHFDRNFAISEALTKEQIAARKATQEQDKKADRVYADNLKDQIYSDLKSDKISFEQAMEIVRNDKHIDYKNWDFTVGDPAISYNTKDTSGSMNLLENDVFKDALLSTSEGGIATPFLMQLDYGIEPEVKMVDSQWVILRVTEEYLGEANSFSSWLTAQEERLDVKILKDNFNLLELISGKAYAWSSDICGAGRTNQGSSRPGEAMAEARQIDAAGNNTAMSNVYAYFHTGSGAYAYSGCPLTTGYTINGTAGWSRTAISNASGCMPGMDLCCSGNHNPHSFATGYSGDLPANSYWYGYYKGTTDGSGWGSFLTAGFQTGYGSRYSNSTATFSIVNGDTVYIRAYYKIDPPPPPVNAAPTPIAVSACQNGDCDGTMQVDVNGGASVQLTAKATDAENDPVAVHVTYKKVGDTGWKNFGTGSETASPDGTGTSAIIYGSSVYATNTVFGTIPADINAFGWRSISSGNPNSAANTNISLPSVYLSPGTYNWSVRAVDSKLAYSGWSAYSTFTVSAPAPTITCEVTPRAGLSPLVVVVSATVVNPVLGTNYAFNYNMGDGSVLTGSSSPIYYTYPANAVGQMNISVTSDNIPGFTCPCTTTIQNPSDGGGGEVAL